jgi:lipid A ethanolaminephosphotransferase
VLPLGEDAKLGASYTAQTKPPLLLLVLGETARSGNFGINGYGRPPTRCWPKKTSPASATPGPAAPAPPPRCPACSRTSGAKPTTRASANYENLLDVLQRAGLAVLWMDNQSGCKGVCDRVPNVDTSASSRTRACATAANALTR